MLVAIKEAGVFSPIVFCGTLPSLLKPTLSAKANVVACLAKFVCQRVI